MPATPAPSPRWPDLSVRHQLRDALTPVRGRAELLVQHLHAGNRDPAALIAEAERLVALIAHLEAVIERHHGEGE